MSVPVFEEVEPAADCGCPGCARQRRDLALGLPVRLGGHPAAHGPRRALVLVTAAGVVLGGGGAAAGALSPLVEPFTPADAAGRAHPAGPGHRGEAHAPAVHGAASSVRRAPAAAGEPAVLRERAAPADGPETPQGGREPLHGAPGPGSQPSPGSLPSTSQISTESLNTTTRAEIINRAKKWVAAKVPYSMEKYWTDGYRQDCSGYISMAWNLRSNEWTGSLDRFGTRIERAELQPGDILLFHNPANPTRGSHVTIFGGWTDYTHTAYVAY
ncbi:NlpC/P60 family protein, partial [Streptomyces sp.]